LTRWRYAAATDIGLVRQTNQDAFYVDDALAVIADGMGGHAAGEVAAAISIDMVCAGFRENQNVEGLVEAIQSANRAVVSDARGNPEHFGMATTIIAVGLTYDLEGVVSPTLVHVGDSRAYQLRDGALRQLSDDHSVAEEWVRMGRLTAEEAVVHPRRHQLTRGVGVEDTIAIDVRSISALVGDRVLLCSDGLSNELDSDTLARLASAPNGLEMAVESLVSEAKVAGGRDNISAILLEFDEVNVATFPIHRTMSTAPPPVTSGVRTSSVRRRRWTWRVWASVLIVIALIVGFFSVLHWYAYSNYYLGDDAGNVAVYQGQSHGFLWYQPVLVFDTIYTVNQFLPIDERAIARTISEPSLSEALVSVKSLHRNWELSRVPTSTTTTTTITTTTTSTTLAKTTTTAKKG
jgi:protein phosphatase